jgi:hypothetical protein
MAMAEGVTMAAETAMPETAMPMAAGFSRGREGSGAEKSRQRHARACDRSHDVSFHVVPAPRVARPTWPAAARCR